MMKRGSVHISAALALVAGAGLSSCSLVKRYAVYTDQISPVREDRVEVEEDEGLAGSRPEAGLKLSDLRFDQQKPEIDGQDTQPLAVSQKQPDIAKPADNASQASSLVSQNRPKVDAVPQPTPTAKQVAAQNQPKIDTPKPAAAPVPAPAAKPVVSQNQPKIEAPKPAAKPEPKPVTSQNQPKVEAPKPTAKPAAKPAAKPVTSQNQPKVEAPKPTAKPAAKPAAKPVTGQNQPKVEAPKPTAKPAAKPAAKPVTGQNQPKVEAPKPTAKSTAKAPAAQPAAKAKSRKTYTPVIVTLKPGDSLQGIARQHGVTVAALCKENGLTATTKLRRGMQLRIPKRSFFRRLFHWPWFTRSSAVEPAPVAAPKQRASSRSKRKYRTHTVQQGETLSSIAEKYSVSSSTLIQVNELSSREARRLQYGRKILIPITR